MDDHVETKTPLHLWINDLRTALDVQAGTINHERHRNTRLVWQIDRLRVRSWGMLIVGLLLGLML